MKELAKIVVNKDQAGQQQRVAFATWNEVLQTICYIIVYFFKTNEPNRSIFPHNLANTLQIKIRVECGKNIKYF